MLASLLTQTKIPQNHDEIINAWEKRDSELKNIGFCLDTDSKNFLDDLRAQKQEAEDEARKKEAEAKARDEKLLSLFAELGKTEGEKKQKNSDKEESLPDALDGDGR